MNKLICFYEKVIENGLLILVCIVPLVFEPKGFNPVLIKTTFAHIVIFTLFLVWLVKSIEEQKFRLIKTPLNLPLLFFFFTCILSFIFSDYKYISIKGLSDFFCYVMLFFIVIHNVKTVNKMLTVFLVSSAIVSFYGLLQHFGIDFIPWIRGGRLISSMGGANFFAGYLIVVIPICLGTFFAIKSRTGKTLCAILLFSLVLCLAWTFTRSSWLAFILGLLLFIILKTRRAGLKNIISWKNFAKIAFFFMLIVIVICIASGSADLRLFKNRTLSIFSSITGISREIPQMLLKPYQFQSQIGESPGARITIWQGAYRMFLNRPIFGHGVGTFEVSFPEFRPVFYRYKFGNIHTEPHAHSEYLEILSEQGILGLGMFLWFIFVFFGGTLKGLKKFDESNFNLALGGICAVFSLLIEGFVSVNLRWTSPAVFFWLVMGLVFVIDKQQVAESTESQTSQPYVKINLARRTKYLIYILLMIVGAFLWIKEINLFNSNFHLGRAVKFARVIERPGLSLAEYEKSLKDSAVEYEKSLRVESTNIRTLYYLGASYSLLGCWNEARDAYLEVNRFAPHYQQVDYNLGIVYYRLGMIEKSIEYLNRATALDIGNIEAPKMIKALNKTKR